MTRLLGEVLAQVRKWPEDRQDAAARILLSVQEQEARRFTLTPDQIERVRTSKAQADAGEFVPDEEVNAFFAKYGG